VLAESPVTPPGGITPATSRGSSPKPSRTSSPKISPRARGGRRRRSPKQHGSSAEKPDAEDSSSAGGAASDVTELFAWHPQRHAKPTKGDQQHESNSNVSTDIDSRTTISKSTISRTAISKDAESRSLSPSLPKQKGYVKNDDRLDDLLTTAGEARLRESLQRLEGAVSIATLSPRLRVGKSQKAENMAA